MNIKYTLKLFQLLAVSHLFLNVCGLSAASLSVDTNYKLSGVSYSNLDYDAKTSSDSVSYYTQRLRLGITGKFAPGIEICAKMQSLSVVGSTLSLPSSLVWREGMPFPAVDGTPFVENLFFKIRDIFDQPADIIIGRQPLESGDGLISDNSAGLNAFRLIVKYPQNFKGDVFTAKISEGFFPDSDYDVYGIAGAYKRKNDLFELLYLFENDCSKKIYVQGGSSEKTSRIAKNFYSGRLYREDEFGEYKIGIVKQNGEIVKENGSAVQLDGYAWNVSGILKVKNTKVGDVSAGLLLSMFSGDDDATSTTDKDENFSPGLASRYDGLEPAGYGKIFSAGMNKTAIGIDPGYSGINTLGLLFEFSPFYGWTFGVNYFLYSASAHSLKPTKEASGFEKILGAKYSLGIEMDIYLKFVQSKYIEAYLGYFRYTPPPDVFWPKTDALSKYQLDITTRF